MQWTLVLLIWMGQYCVIVCQLYEFHYINENKNWTEAQQYCREKHIDLATVTNMKDMERLNNILPGDWSGAWIGLYYQTDGTRKWHWSDPGLEFNENETNWNQGEPNDATGWQNCGIIWKSLKWGDLSCNDPRYFLCYDDRNSSKKYHLIQERKTWAEAQSYCREKHTDLISGTKQLQDEEVKKETSSVGDDTYILIGLFREKWRWSDGSSFSFRNWTKLFDYQAEYRGQCAMTVFDNGGRWRNENCDGRKPFICYDDEVILIKENKTWEDALTYCRDHYDDLVTITNMDDQRWIQEKVKNASTDYVWMGLSYACTLDLWFWVSDEMVIYKNWAKGEPMDDCDMSGAMETRGKHQWFKMNDTEKFNFICSK
ncbi:macrophage mannose receptor 1-like [Xiphophorus couchianus]|uniref:macrophage mannose receptor 1-like n=1 Tax=Xiphophorus couchianus TaxID=32473 RepID=UPI001015F013|nr:macrophage mannose receptor 1-like [Xiphophorus couchianus]XP_027893788.1 macrophage mannose receptor 1-like [Xiphophorus couchianus]